jgi:CBS domain-containing protein
MFHVFGTQGRVLAPTLEEVRRLSPVSGIARARRVALFDLATGEPLAVAASPVAGSLPAQAYGLAAGPRSREALTCVGDVMHQPVISVLTTMTVDGAWQLLLQHGVGQAPVLDESGALVGLVGRAELLPMPALAPARDESARLTLMSSPVAAVMWSPVPAVQAQTDLRRTAALLLATGLPGVPVTDAAGRLMAFVSRSDLLRAMVTDPPLDVWG